MVRLFRGYPIQPGWFWGSGSQIGEASCQEKVICIPKLVSAKSLALGSLTQTVNRPPQATHGHNILRTTYDNVAAQHIQNTSRVCGRWCVCVCGVCECVCVRVCVGGIGAMLGKCGVLYCKLALALGTDSCTTQKQCCRPRLDMQSDDHTCQTPMLRMACHLEVPG